MQVAATFIVSKGVGYFALSPPQGGKKAQYLISCWVCSLIALGVAVGSEWGVHMGEVLDESVDSV